MIKLIIKKFISDYENIKDNNVRKNYGILSGILGIICNLILFSIKIVTGILMNSIAIISDAFNNLTDSGSSFITILGAKFSSKPPDKEHPYGHGRFEYVASLIVSFIIFGVGIELLRNSINKIIHPEAIQINLFSIIILSLSILIKLWMYSYNRYIGILINSSMNKATAKDSLNDAIATTGVIAGTAIGAVLEFPVDGLLGVIISILIIYTGFTTARDSVNVLLGTSPDPELLDKIQYLIDQNQTINYVHDLKIHDYGPGRLMASMHVVVPPEMTVADAHFIIHGLEQKIEQELGIEIVIHIDPVKDIDENPDLLKKDFRSPQ